MIKPIAALLAAVIAGEYKTKLAACVYVICNTPYLKFTAA